MRRERYVAALLLLPVLVAGAEPWNSPLGEARVWVLEN